MDLQGDVDIGCALPTMISKLHTDDIKSVNLYFKTRISLMKLIDGGNTFINCYASVLTLILYIMYKM